jgi:hypothetical protein
VSFTLNAGQLEICQYTL